MRLFARPLPETVAQMVRDGCDAIDVSAVCALGELLEGLVAGSRLVTHLALGDAEKCAIALEWRESDEPRGSSADVEPPPGSDAPPGRCPECGGPLVQMGEGPICSSCGYEPPAPGR